MGRTLVREMNRGIDALGLEGSCVYGDGPLFHVLLGRGACANPDGTLKAGSADVLTLRQANRPEVKAALQAGMLGRGIDLMSGYGGIIATTHTLEEISLAATAFHDTLKEMVQAGVLAPVGVR
jgi:hypothetical protein